MLNQEEIIQQQNLLANHRATLAILLGQVAIHTTAHAPPAQISGITEARASIAHIKAILRKNGLEVENHSDDEAQPQTVHILTPIVPDEWSNNVSISQHQNAIVRLKKDVAALESKVGKEVENESRAKKDILRIEKSITKNTSISLRQSRERKITHLTSEIAQCRKTKSAYEEQLARKTQELHRHEQQLFRKEIDQQKKKNQEQDRGQRDLLNVQRQRQAEELRHHHSVTEEILKQVELQDLIHSKPAKLWRIGSFWILAFVIVAGLVLVISSNIGNLWVFLLTLLAIETFMITIGAFVLRSIGDLSEKGFLQLIELALKFQLRGVRGLKKQDDLVEN